MSTLTRAGSVRIRATRPRAITPYTGTRLAFSFDQYWPPGTAPSRLNANSMRVVLVMQATVQKNWPTVEMTMIEAAQFGVSAWWKMLLRRRRRPAFASSCTANRNDSSRIQPPMPE